MLFGSIILTIYVISIVLLLFGYSKVKELKVDIAKEETTLHHNFSIIIPFRYEAKNLPALLESISKLKYPKENFELIFVDDESEDDSVIIIERFFKSFNGTLTLRQAQCDTQVSDEKIQFKIIENNRKSKSPKKDAITEAIKISKHEWVVTTDSDCLLPENWLVALNRFISENNPTMIVGPVKYTLNNSLINNYQQLDNFSLQTTTVGAFGWNHPILCNGANLAYKKEEFDTVSGFSENDHIASGDDVFLLEKFRNRNPKSVQFIKSKDSLVVTKAQDSWKDIINQRVRWASKTSKQKDVFTLLLGGVVFLTNLLVTFGLIVSILQIGFYRFFFSFLLIKIIMDFIVLHRTSVFFRNKINIPYFLINTLLYPIITVIVVLKSFRGNYEWKGRAFNSK